MANFCQQVLKPLGSYTRVFTVSNELEIQPTFSHIGLRQWLERLTGDHYLLFYIAQISMCI